MKIEKIAVIIPLLLFAHLNPVAAGYIQPKSALVINIDISRFRFSQDSSYLEVYYAIYPRNVTLEKIRDTLQGGVLLQTKIRDANNKTVVDYSSKITIHLNDTTSVEGSYVGKTIYALPLGSYELGIFGTDIKNPSRKDSSNTKFVLSRYDASPAISDIDLCSRIIESGEKSNMFYKNAYEVTPNPSLLFGGKATPVVFSYAELYNLKPDTIYSIVIGITDAKGNFLKERKRIHKYSTHSVVDVNSLDIHSIPSGRYKFVLIIADTSGKEAARNEKQILIYNPQLQASSIALISPGTADFSGLSNDELIDEFRKLQYFTSSEDVDAFEKLNDADARRKFLADLWAQIESGRRGIRDLTRTMFLSRVSLSNQRFHAMGREGWRTDRGRIYIIFGEPDEIERFPNTFDSKPYEIWHYNQIENGVIFIFVDRTGSDDYMLVHSTKRGEIQDINWEQYLH